MTLKLLTTKPDHLLAEGEHVGYKWVVVHNGMGFRCGYVRVPSSHPWHGKSYDDIECEVHGGLTYAKADSVTDKLETDAGYWWLGFDCAHAWDLPDPALPCESPMCLIDFGDGEIRTQDYVEVECKSLCQQAKEAE